MPVPKKTDSVPDPIAAVVAETSPVVENDMIVQEETTLDTQAVIEGTESTATKIADSLAPKPKRGRQAGAPAPPPFDQRHMNVVRNAARRLASQQLAAGLDPNVDSGKLYEAVKDDPLFVGMDRARLVSKYKQGLKEIANSSQGENINSQQMEHVLWLPPLTTSRSKVSWLELPEGQE